MTKWGLSQENKVGLPWKKPINAIHHIKKLEGFPGGAVVESLPANAGDTGSSPGLGRSHMPRSGWAREPQLLSLHVWSLCSATREAVVVRGLCAAMRSGPHLTRLERALAQRRGPNTAIKKERKNPRQKRWWFKKKKKKKLEKKIHVINMDLCQ